MTKAKEALKRSMTAHKGSVTKQMINCRTLQEDSNTSHAEFQASLNTLQRRFDSYEESYHKYLEVVIETEEESTLEKAATDAFEAFEEDFQVNLRQFHAKLQLATTSQQPNPAPVCQSKPVTQFEKLKLTIFNGDLMAGQIYGRGLTNLFFRISNFLTQKKVCSSTSACFHQQLMWSRAYSGRILISVKLYNS